MTIKMYADKTTVEGRAAFVAELRQVCEKHGLSLEHEDQHGAFLVTPFCEGADEWLSHARADYVTMYGDAPVPAGLVQVEHFNGRIRIVAPQA